MHNDNITKIRLPTPGGKRHHTQSYTTRNVSKQYLSPVNLKGLNPLVEAAATLLSLTSQLSIQTHDPGVAKLRKKVGAEMNSFTRTAINSGIDTEIVDKASYALCAFIDETVMETPWSGDNFWPQNTLLVEFHNDTLGGERFFEILQECRDNPSDYLELLELMYLCLTFGFEGTYKVDKQDEVEQIRQDLYAELRRHRGEIDLELSPHWRGIEKPGGLTRHIPLWLIGAMMLALLVMVYIGFKNSLTDVSFPVFVKLENIQPKLMMVNSPKKSVTRTKKPPPRPMVVNLPKKSVIRTEPPPRPMVVNLPKKSVPLPGSKPFDGAYNSYILKFVRGDKLTNLHKKVLQKFVDRVNANSEYRNIGVKIIGRASPTPPGADVYNQKLSKRRAQSVRRYLKGRSDHKLPTVKIVSVKGLGAYKNPLQPREGENESFNEINQSVQVLVVHQKKD